jgi:hypothetical protein
MPPSVVKRYKAVRRSSLEVDKMGTITVRRAATVSSTSKNAFAVDQEVEANYSASGSWYSAVVRSYDPVKDSYEVYYPEDDESETLPSKFVRAMRGAAAQGTKPPESIINDDGDDDGDLLVDVPRDVYFADVKLQMATAQWERPFNARLPPKRIHFLHCHCIELVPKDAGPDWQPGSGEVLAVERYIKGEYIKHNSNGGYVESHHRMTPQAFSHFSFVMSQGEEMVVDIQVSEHLGLGGNEEMTKCIEVTNLFLAKPSLIRTSNVNIQGVGDLWTDPQVHSKTMHYGSADLGLKGMALFFATHECNDLCRFLCLPPFKLSRAQCQRCRIQNCGDEARSADAAAAAAAADDDDDDDDAFGLGTPPLMDEPPRRGTTVVPPKPPARSLSAADDQPVEGLSCRSQSELDEITFLPLPDVSAPSIAVIEKELRAFHAPTKAKRQLSGATAPPQGIDAVLPGVRGALSPAPVAVAASDTEEWLAAALSPFRRSLAQVHIAMAELHNLGQLSVSSDGNYRDPDQKSCYYHLHQAACLGETKAMWALSCAYVDLPCPLRAFPLPAKSLPPPDPMRSAESFLEAPPAMALEGDAAKAVALLADIVAVYRRQEHRAKEESFEALLAAAALERLAQFLESGLGEEPSYILPDKEKALQCASDAWEILSSSSLTARLSEKQREEELPELPLTNHELLALLGKLALEVGGESRAARAAEWYGLAVEEAMANIAGAAAEKYARLGAEASAAAEK